MKFEVEVRLDPPKGKADEDIHTNSTLLDSARYSVNVGRVKNPALAAAEQGLKTFREHGHGSDGTYDERVLTVTAKPRF